MNGEAGAKFLTVEQVADLQAEMGREFEAIDIEDGERGLLLYQTAEHYAKGYCGSFDFMLEMRRAAERGSFTDGRAKGVLNCMAAEGRRRKEAAEAKAMAEAAPEPESTAGPLAAGIYQVGDVVLSAEAPTFGAFDEGTMVVKYRVEQRGPDDRKWQGFAFVDAAGQVRVWKSQGFAVRQAAALRALVAAADRLAYGFAYALQSGRCFVCGKELDDPVSVKALIGPVCAKRLGIKREPLTDDERELARFKALVEAGADAIASA